MTSRRVVIVCGVLAVALAVIGSITAASVVGAGGLEGGVYLTVNIVLALLGVVLVVIGVRSPRAPAGARAKTPPTSS